MTPVFVAGAVGTADDHAALTAALQTVAPDAGVDVATSGDVRLAATGTIARDPAGGLCVLDGWIEDLSPGEAASVALARWRADGLDALWTLRGEFAVVLTDGRRVVLARDQLGTRALFWSGSGRHVRFASELRPLLALSPTTPPPDHRALARWLAGDELPDEATLFAGIRRVPPGGALQASDAGATTTRWWRPTYREPENVDRADAAERVREALGAAVAARSPAALLLSGGLDSAAVAAFGAVRAYSASFPGFPYTDESERIDVIVQHLGLDGARISVGGQGLLAGGLRHIERWGVPPGGWSDFWEAPLLRKAADDGCEAVVSGDGGDEVFGVREALIADHLRRGRLLAAWRTVGRVPGASGSPRRARAQYLRDHGLRGALPAKAHRLLRERHPAASRSAWLRDELRRDLARTEGAWAWQESLDAPRWWSAKARELTTRIEALGLFDHLRRRAAAAGLEARHPILSLDVVETVLALPPEVFFDAERDRPLLRDALRGRLPDAVRLHPSKAMFNRLVGANVLGELDAIRTVLAAPSDDVAVAPGAIERLLDQGPEGHPHGQLHWVREVLRLTLAECWLRELAAPGTVAAMLDQGVFGAPELDVVPLGTN